jgi:hypothetical protein
MQCPPINDLERKNIWSDCRCNGTAGPKCKDPKYAYRDGKSHKCGKWTGCGDSKYPSKRRCFWTNYPQDIVSKAKCCLSRTELKECDPGYCPGNKNCLPVLAQYCAQNNRIGSAECRSLRDNPDTSMLYNALLEEHCIGDNMKDSVCLTDLFKGNMDLYRTVIQKQCSSKYKLPEWSEFCACFRPQSVYQKLSATIAKKWNGPPHAMSAKAECILPECAASPMADKDAYCGKVSFATCVQNAYIDVDGSTVGDITLNPTIQGCGSFSPKAPDVADIINELELEDEEDDNPYKDVPQGAPHRSDADDDDSGMSTTFILILFFIFVCVAAAIAYMLMNTDDSVPSTLGEPTQGGYLFRNKV